MVLQKIAKVRGESFFPLIAKIPSTASACAVMFLMLSYHAKGALPGLPRPVWQRILEQFRAVFSWLVTLAVRCSLTTMTSPSNVITEQQTSIHLIWIFAIQSLRLKKIPSMKQIFSWNPNFDVSSLDALSGSESAVLQPCGINAVGIPSRWIV